MRPLALVLLITAAGCTPSGDAPAPPAAADSVQVRTVRDDSTGAELPRVSLLGRPDAEARVNAALDSLSASMRCDPESAPPDAEYTSRAAVTMAAHGVLSVTIHSSYWCGGAYPTNDANQSVTFDLTTGEAVPFEALFRDLDGDRAAITGVIQTTLLPEATDENPDCAEPLSTEALMSTTFSYALGADGLIVQPDFPHVIAACAAEITVPYGSLRAYARDGGALARVADGQSAAAD